MDIKVCPSTLLQGYDRYSPFAIKHLFNGENISPFIELDFEKDVTRGEIAANMHRLSVSGVQEKMSAIIVNGKIRLKDKGKTPMEDFAVLVGKILRINGTTYVSSKNESTAT